MIWKNITFALYPKSAKERALVKATVDKLHQAKVLFYNGISDAYEFKKSEAVDFDTAIEVYKKDPTNYPQNIAQAVEAAIPFTKDDLYLEAKGYNALYNEDKRFKRKLVTIADLEQTEKMDGVNVNIFTALQRQLEAPMRLERFFRRLGSICSVPNT